MRLEQAHTSQYASGLNAASRDDREPEMTKPFENPPKPAGNSRERAGETRKNTGSPQALPREIGGRDGPEPTRFGDWEKNGRCIDF